MKVVGLVSGGKDSCFAMMKCVEYGHQFVALANLMPADDSVDELDSYMYQTVGHQIVVSFAKCMGVPLFRRRIQGSTRHHNLSYSMTPGDEVEDMFVLLNEVNNRYPLSQQCLLVRLRLTIKDYGWKVYVRGCSHWIGSFELRSTWAKKYHT